MSYIKQIPDKQDACEDNDLCRVYEARDCYNKMFPLVKSHCPILCKRCRGYNKKYNKKHVIVTNIKHVRHVPISHKGKNEH